MDNLVARNLSPAFGAEIEGLDLGSRFDDDTVRFLREVFDERGLLLFRNAELDRAAQVYVTEILRGLAPPSPEAADAIATRQGTFWISNKEPDAAAPFGRLMFHCDGMWSTAPFEVLSLYGVEIEPPVVPTMFASAAHAWATLADEVRERVTALRAVHVSGPEYVHERRRRGFEGELVQAKREHVPSHTMPVAYQHPRTGQTLLYVTQGMTKEIEGMTAEESEDLLDELFAHLYGPDNLLEHEWNEGDIVFWDNLAVQHARPNVTTEGPARTLRKIGLPVDESMRTAALVDSYEPVS